MISKKKIPERARLGNSILSSRERAELIESERIIEQGFHTFLDVGRALLRIKSERLYRETHKTFEGYCRDRFEMSRINAYRQINAAEVCALLPNGGTPRPANEAQLRPLSSVPRAKAPGLWLQVVKAAGGKKITGRAVQKVVQAWKQRSSNEPAYPALAYWQELCLGHIRKIRKEILSDRPQNVVNEVEKIKLLLQQIVLNKIQPDNNNDCV